MYERLANLFKSLGDPTRLKILSLLIWTESLCVSHMVEFLDTPQPTISRHLRILKDSGWLETKHKGQFIYYQMASSLPLEMEILEYALRRIFNANVFKEEKVRFQRFLSEIQKIKQDKETNLA